YRGFPGGRPCDVDAHGDAHGLVYDAIVIQKVLGLVMAGRDGAEEGSHHLFGIDEQIGGGFFHARDSVAVADFAEAQGSGLASGDLGSEVAFAFFGCADVVEEKGQHIGNKLSTAHDFDRRNAEALLVNFAAGAHGARVSSAHIGMVSAGSDVEVGRGCVGRPPLPLLMYTGITSVMSGRCVPPRNGSLSMTTSPGCSSHCATAAATDMGMEPR